MTSETIDDMCTVRLSGANDHTFIVNISGQWLLEKKTPSPEIVLKELNKNSHIDQIVFNAEKMEKWDSSLLLFLMHLKNKCLSQNIKIKYTAFPQGVIRLIGLSSSNKNQKKPHIQSHHTRLTFFEKIGDSTIRAIQQLRDILDFIGEAVLAFLNIIRGKPRFRKSDFLIFIQDSGAGSLPIISLISFLMGLILAFMGAVQLKPFGAQIYIASLVGIATVRINGAVMTSVIMAGRTGASYAAQIGTMQVNEEIDALKTMGISPMEFLVIPRILALSLMMPLLCLYADIIGILGGMLVGVTLFDINIIEYYNMTVESVKITDYFVGLFHSIVFGILVALCGCYQGLKCERSAKAVGHATTAAVVSGIVNIVFATAVITILCHLLGV